MKKRSPSSPRPRRGTLTVASGGTIVANGRDSVNLNTARLGIPGGGGGADGVLVLIGKTSMSVVGAIRADGGKRRHRLGTGTPATPRAEAVAGGIIHLLSSVAPSIAGTTSTTAGTAGGGRPIGGATTNSGGGGACGGSGGSDGITRTAATGGSPGYLIITTTPTPESLPLWSALGWGLGRS